MAEKQARSITPQHIAIIMDGNGKWAKKKLLPKIMGHRRGVEAAKDISRACKRLGVKYLTLYVFSHENWGRPSDEVEGVMNILRDYLKNNLEELQKEDVCLKFIGDLSMLPSDIKELADSVSKQTESNSFKLIFALSYGARQEIKNAALNFANDALSGKIVPTQDLFENYLYTSGIPDPDLLIRTGGEHRISNFLLYQISYAELYFTPTLWPDFKAQDLEKAVEEYSYRDRRYGERHNESL
jgi:undecaprenyl diphosphate synthase